MTTRHHLILGLLVLAGCGSDRNQCVVGASVSCACPGGATGAQVCQADGTFNACSCYPDAGPIDARPASPGDAAAPDAPTPVDAAVVPPDAAAIDVPLATTGTYYHYVTDSLKVGATVAEADSYAFNLDGDPRNVPDDAVGHVLAGLSSMLDVDGAINASIAASQTVILFSVRADSLVNDPSVAWRDYLGQPGPAVDPAAPSDGSVVGAISGQTFLGGPGVLEIELGLVAGQPPVAIRLVGAHLSATCTSSGCADGKLGGGVTMSDMMTKVIPAIATVLNARVAADGECSRMCQTSGACSSSSTQLLDLFDTNHDCMITAPELEANSLIQAVLQPDVDLLDADGAPCGVGTSVTCDGVKESVSFALGFTAKAAVFTVPGEQ